ncbi:4'-phosphopantetheinyl transferase family protein [Actinocorallia aurantiaca]|uniref:4'-phosphopantetheinyl transferase domain-containing protein n=1 Tax=Actinocorallia aurantiaca TaxID=46204 RepID=A0ABN3U509_9ACTN
MSAGLRTLTQAAGLTVGGAAVEVWTAEAREVPEDGWEMLAPDDLRYLARLALPQVRAEAAHGRAILRWVLGDRLGLPAERVRFARTLTGRPYLPGADWDFSLSYSSGLVCVAVAHRARIGVDVERVRPLDKGDAVAERFFSPADRAALDALDGAAREAYWFQAWTRTEALIKAHGSGLLDPPPTGGPGSPAVPLPVPAGFAGAVAALDWNGGPGCTTT